LARYRPLYENCKFLPPDSIFYALADRGSHWNCIIPNDLKKLKEIEDIRRSFLAL